MMDAPPLVSFVTVNYKMRHLIRHLLRGLEEARLSFPFEYFLVDNHSEDGIAELIRERFPWVRLIESPGNLGFGGGNNLALREARGRYVILLNPDLSIFPGEMEKWLEWLEAHPDIGISGPRVVNPDGTDQESCFRFHTLLTPLYRRTGLGQTSWGERALDHFLMKGMNREVEQDVDWVLGAAMSIQRPLLDQIGHFDERFFMYFEDADLCRRAWQVGARVSYTPAAKFVHYHQRQSQTRYPWEALTSPLARAHIASGVKYFLKYYGQPNPRLGDQSSS